MKKLFCLWICFLLFLAMTACGDKKENAKGEEKKEEQKQTEQKIQSKPDKVKPIHENKFNHSASLKITQMAKEIPEIQDPIIVVYGKDAVMGYKTAGQADPTEIEDKMKEKLHISMPTYRIRMSAEPEWYNQIARLYQDTIDSEGSTVKDLKDTFRSLQKNGQ